MSKAFERVVWLSLDIHVNEGTEEEPVFRPTHSFRIIMGDPDELGPEALPGIAKETAAALVSELRRTFRDEEQIGWTE